jgi:hypothetical protein
MQPAKKRPNSSSFIIIHVGQVQEKNLETTKNASSLLGEDEEHMHKTKRSLNFNFKHDYSGLDCQRHTATNERHSFILTDDNGGYTTRKSSKRQPANIYNHIKCLCTSISCLGFFEK